MQGRSVIVCSSFIKRGLLLSSKVENYAPTNTGPIKFKRYSSASSSTAVKTSQEEPQESDHQVSFVQGEQVPPPVIAGRKLDYLDPCRQPRQAWVENLDTVEEKKLGMVDLHPDVFGSFPRTDIIASNVHWQRLYKKINWDWTPTRGEMRGGGRKPWPQKGLGKARHGSIRSPIWINGSKAHGPRGPKSYFYMLPFYQRVRGLCATLSVKLAQDDLKIVDSLEIPSEDPKFLQNLVEERQWGLSVLFIDDSDIMPRNISLATDSIGQMNLMPVYGLNVFSMLKHETLVLTVPALNKLEEKLIFHLHRNDPITPAKKFKNAFI